MLIYLLMRLFANNQCINKYVILPQDRNNS
nr:MAG TPA_asm: hypothetical protein [Caudoviricetes sp.]